MRHSFQRRLLLHIGTAVVALGLLAAVAQFVLAWRELRESQDDMLRQVAALVLAHPGRASSPLQHLRLGDHDSRLLLAVVPIDPAPAWLKPLPAPGLHTLDTPGGRMRIAIERSGPYTAIVAQPTDARDEMAWSGAVRALLPSLVLVLVLVGLIHRLVRTEFGPIVRAARQLEAQDALHEPHVDIGDVPSEIRPFTAAIEGLLRRSHELMQQQQRFVADAAHELRSPLTALALQARNLRQARSLDEARQRMLPLEQGIERARRLSEQLLGLARIDSATHAAEPTDLGAMGRELLAEFLARAEARGIDLGLEAPERLLIHTVPSLLRTVVSNALDNAIKYSPRGGEVTLAMRAIPGAVQCDVIDSGPSIPEAERVNVFKPFLRLQDNEVEGTGLGLAIAQEAAARLHARLSLLDRPDRQGLVFRLEVPDSRAC